VKTLDLVKRAGHSLSNAKVRTLLTSLAIAVGAFTLTLTLAATAGANHYADQLVKSNFDPAVLLVTKDDRLFGQDPSGFNKPQEYDDTQTSGIGPRDIQLKRLTQDDIRKIEKTTGVTSVTPTYPVQVQYITRPNQKKYIASVDTYNPGQRPDVASGKLPEGEKQLADGTILLPESYIPTLGFKTSEAAIGQVVIAQLQRPTKVDPAKIEHIFLTQGASGLQNLQSYETETDTFTISGVTRKSSTALQAAASLFINSTDAARLSSFTTLGTENYQKYVTAQVRVEGGDQKVNRDAAKELLKKQGYQVETVEDIQKILLQIISILQGIVSGFGVIALIAAVFGIINTQYISVLERTREIGLMKALGMRGLDIGWLFRIEAAWIGFLGGVIGAGLAFAVGTGLNPWLTQQLGLGAGNDLLIFQVLPIAFLIVGLMLVAILAGWLPARKAAKLDPIEALRTE